MIDSHRGLEDCQHRALVAIDRVKLSGRSRLTGRMVVAEDLAVVKLPISWLPLPHRFARETARHLDFRHVTWDLEFMITQKTPACLLTSSLTRDPIDNSHVFIGMFTPWQNNLEPQMPRR